jgi:hypothetical protein
MSSRKVLLLEPNYRNKYPPMGLMKLAMYHRLQGDDVVFYKGDFAKFVLSEITSDAITKLSEVDREISWRKFRPDIQSFIQYGKVAPGSTFEQAFQRPFVPKWLDSFKRFYRTDGYYEKPRWDRVCVTTLFTFYWDITIETIEFAKKICKDTTQVLVGGILASVIPEKVMLKTGILPHVGAIHAKKLLHDKPIESSIDELPLDYSILEEIDYRYPATDAYYSYATRGCVRNCSFCAVPKIEPGGLKYYPIQQKLDAISQRFGKQRHLLLLDNNVFASPKFDKIIDEIHDSGFAKGATFIPPNQLDIVIRQLQDSWNDRAYIRTAVRILNAFVTKLEGERYNHFYRLLLNHELLHDYTATKDGIFSVYKDIKDDYGKARYKKPVVRFIDFNQGMDARLATPKNMAKLATVAIRPLRIAFDSWTGRQFYARAIRFAQENGITQMSNYLLYNFHDKPIDLYNRLLLNIDLCDELGVNIYSFPMKYHPIMDEKWFSNRDYIGNNWTRKAIRTVQAVLNSTHGKIGKGRTFFFKAFGRSEAEFEDLIRMPEAFIIKRWDAELGGLTGRWRKAYTALSETERAFVNAIVDTNVFSAEMWQGQSSAVRKALDFYLIKCEDILPANERAKKRHIKKFESSCPPKISDECARLLGRRP